MVRLRWSWVAMVLIGACGGSDGVPLDEYVDRYLDAYCQNQFACGVYDRVESCMAPLVGRHQLEQSVAAGRTSYDAATALACLEARLVLTCDVTDKAWLRGPPACRDVFAGTVPDGGACFVSSECVSDECTAPGCGMACCAGTCAPTVAVGDIGQACGNGRCVDAAYCNGGTCTAFVAAGGMCSAPFYCASGLDCVAGTCQDLPDRGQSCPMGLCAGAGDHCDVDTRTCVPLASLGRPCATSAGCQQPLRCGSGTCREPAALGQVCSAVIECVPGAYCGPGNICATPRADGEACADDGECSSDYCDPFGAAPACAVRPVCS